MILTQRQGGYPTDYYIFYNTTWTAEVFVTERRIISPNNLPAVLFWGWGGRGGGGGGRRGAQYKFVVSKLHCKINFMSTFVSEGNRVTNCQVLMLKIKMSYLPRNVFANFSHDLFLISE